MWEQIKQNVIATLLGASLLAGGTGVTATVLLTWRADANETATAVNTEKVRELSESRVAIETKQERLLQDVADNGKKLDALLRAGGIPVPVTQ